MPETNENPIKSYSYNTNQSGLNNFETKIYNILVIGNGFDLYHGLKTKYIDFVDYTRYITKANGTKKIRKIINNNVFINWFKNVADENQGWIDCEIEIERVLILFRKIIYDKDVFIMHLGRYYIERNNTSLLYFEFDMLGVFKEFINVDREGESYEFKNIYFTKYQGINKSKVLNKLRLELEDLITVLKFYLETEVLDKDYGKLSQQIIDINPEYVINFNYTNTYKKYGILDKDVCFIHGSLNKNNMVLGIKDFNENDIDFIYFKKFFQRIQKNSDTIDNRKFKHEKFIIDEKIKVQKTYIHFFGHSLSNTDGDIIRNICVDDIDRIFIYYVKMKDNSDYEQKVINMIDVLGKESFINNFQTGKIQFIEIK